MGQKASVKWQKANAKIPITIRFRGIWTRRGSKRISRKFNWAFKDALTRATDEMRHQELQVSRPKGTALGRGIRFNPNAKLELLLSNGNGNVARANLSHSLCLSLYSWLNSGFWLLWLLPSGSCLLSEEEVLVFSGGHLVIEAVCTSSRLGDVCMIGSSGSGLAPVTNVRNATMSR